MAKLWASVPGARGSAASPRAESSEAADQRPTAAQPPLDPEMLDLVQRFEKGYAEFEPAEEPQRAAAQATDELFPEFPDIFEDPPAPRPAPAERARVVPMPRREMEAAAPLSARPRDTEGGARPREVRAELDVDLDEAMAILRAAENRTGPAPAPGADDDEAEAQSPLYSADATPPPASRPAHSATDTREAAAPASQRSIAATDWRSKSRNTRTIAGAAAVAALVVGIAAGFVLGRSSAPKPSAVIESSQQGGTQLKLERNLPQP